MFDRLFPRNMGFIVGWSSIQIRSEQSQTSRGFELCFVDSTPFCTDFISINKTHDIYRRSLDNVRSAWSIHLDIKRLIANGHQHPGKQIVLFSAHTEIRFVLIRIKYKWVTLGEDYVLIICNQRWGMAGEKFKYTEANWPMLTLVVLRKRTFDEKCNEMYNLCRENKTYNNSDKASNNTLVITNLGYSS